MCYMIFVVLWDKKLAQRGLKATSVWIDGEPQPPNTPHIRQYFQQPHNHAPDVHVWRFLIGSDLLNQSQPVSVPQRRQPRYPEARLFLKEKYSKSDLTQIPPSWRIPWWLLYCFSWEWEDKRTVHLHPFRRHIVLTNSVIVSLRIWCPVIWRMWMTEPPTDVTVPVVGYGTLGPGVGLLSLFPVFRYFPNFSTLSHHMLAIGYHVHISQVSNMNVIRSM